MVLMMQILLGKKIGRGLGLQSLLMMVEALRLRARNDKMVDVLERRSDRGVEGKIAAAIVVAQTAWVMAVGRMFDRCTPLSVLVATEIEDVVPLITILSDVAEQTQRHALTLSCQPCS